MGTPRVSRPTDLSVPAGDDCDCDCGGNCGRGRTRSGRGDRKRSGGFWPHTRPERGSAEHVQSVDLRALSLLRSSVTSSSSRDSRVEATWSNAGIYRVRWKDRAVFSS
ncbi:hypothetical protein MPTK2_1g04610 [Marchantia polymorpha subsp. ruderalis]